MRIGFVTLFPEVVLQSLAHSIVGRAQEAGRVSFEVANPRDFATDPHRTVDDSPYGGGPGMVLMVPLVAAALRSLAAPSDAPIVLTDPAAPLFSQADARRLALEDTVVFVCGHYEGIDERVREGLCTEARSIGDFVVTGGEIPAALMVDAIVRLLPGVLGDPMSAHDDSHSDGLLGFPAYTRPEEFEGRRVPDVLLSGHHGEIAKWRRAQRLRRTRESRPDLFARADLTRPDLDLL